jgi:hypothetical protein
VSDPLDLPIEGALVGDVFSDRLTELVIVEDGGITVDVGKLSGRAGRGPGHEVLDELALSEAREFASSSGHGGE